MRYPPLSPSFDADARVVFEALATTVEVESRSERQALFPRYARYHALLSREPGMRVYIDPEPGEVLEQPPKGVHPSVTSSVALPEQVESPVPGGGVMVDVRGRFQTSLQVRE